MYSESYYVDRFVERIKSYCYLLTETIESKAKTYINSKAMNAGATFNAFGYGVSRGPLRGVVAKKIITPPKVVFFTFDRITWNKCFINGQTGNIKINLIQDVFSDFDLVIGVWQKKDIHFSAFLPSKTDSVRVALKKYRPCFSNDIPNIGYNFKNMKLDLLENELNDASLEFEEDLEDFGIQKGKIDINVIEKLSICGCLCGILVCERSEAIDLSILERVKGANNPLSKKVAYIIYKEGEEKIEEKLKKAAEGLAHISYIV